MQGCPLSVVLLNMLVNVWTLALRERVPAATPCSFADDTGATATKVGWLSCKCDNTTWLRSGIAGDLTCAK